MKTYSHPATRQDIWLRDVFNFPPFQGTALEVGGYGGITHSNTLLLERFSWDCTLIEAVPEFYRQMAANRPYATCIEAAVCGSGHSWDNMKMFVNGQYSGIRSTMSQMCATGHLERGSETVRVTPKLITDVVERRHFNYISLDIEGGEEHILKDWFNGGGTCDALTVEFNYDGEKFDRLKHLCAENEMRLDRVQGFDMFFLSERATS